jgi:hypothetical protein
LSLTILGADPHRGCSGPSPNDPHEVVFFKRHRSEDAAEAEPGRVALNSYPSKVRGALVAVASASPKRFAGGGYWAAMKGDMTGWFELRVGGPGRHHYRLSCLLDYDAKSVEKPLLVVIDGRTSLSGQRCRMRITRPYAPSGTSTEAGIHAH